MRRFHIGQKVRIIKCYLHHEDLWRIVTITGFADERAHGGEAYWTTSGRWGDWDQFSPVDDASDYKRFMERVLKPVDLGKPVKA